MRNKCILEFNTRNGNRYIYDGNTAIVLPVDDLLYDCLCFLESDESIDITKEKIEEKYKNNYQVKSTLDFISGYANQYGGFYRDENFEYKKRRWQTDFSTYNIQQLLDAGNLHQMILNVTEDCNLRCKYCYLSEEYDFTRNRTNMNMTFDIAKKSLDYFFDKMNKIRKFNPGKTCAITFYGGEPLLNFEVVKKCIEYTKINSPVSVVFNITTNGVLLNDEIMKYLVENDVNITISFDGTRENSKNRVFEKNKESYDLVLERLRKFKIQYPNYTKVSIISVYDLKTDLIANDEFFEKEQLPPVVFVNGVSNNNTNYYSRFSEDDIKKHQEQYIYLLNKYIDCKVNNKKCSSYLTVFFELAFSSILFRARPKDSKLPMIPFTNTCLPGMKISVRADGKFDMCERVNSTIPLGNIDSGIDFESIKNIIVDYNENVTKDCHKCPLSNVCSMCFAQSCGDKCFNKPNCNAIIENFRFLLSVVYSILEENPRAFDFFENKIEWSIYN